MADTKVSALTADTSPTSDDLIVTVNDPGGTPANRKVTLANAIQKAHGLSDGIVKVATGTATVVTAPSGAIVGDTDTQTLTNKTIDGSSNTLSNIAQSSVTNLSTDLSGKQPLDTDLTSIAGLTPTDDDVIQRKSGAWTNRTMAQVKTDLVLVKGDVGLGNVTNDAQLKIASNLSDVANAATSFDNIKQAATTSATGVVELATTAETDTGTDTTRVVTPDGLAGSYAGAKMASLYVVDGATTLTTGDGKAYLRIPSYLNGMNLVSCSAAVITTSSSGTPTVMLARGRQSSATSAHTFADMLSTAITIDANEYDSKDATTAAVINGSNDDVATGDLIRVDVDVAGTGTKGLIVTMSFQLP